MKKVIAYEDGGVKIFDTVRDAARHYGMLVTTVYRRIADGLVTADGVSFDWFCE